MKKEDKILILGSRGLVGSAIVRCLKADGHSNILTPVREELDLMNQEKVMAYFKENRPEYVVLAAARVGGIYANDTYRADFIHENLVIQSNVFGAAHEYPVKRLLFLGSSCIYPKDCPQPMKEEYLLTGPLEPTNEPYAIAKIAGLKTAENFRRQYGEKFYSVMPTNLYGENDNFHKENSHVIPGLIARMTEAMEKGESVFKVWGTGKPKREFLYVDDMARGCIYILKYEGEVPDLVNVGYGTDVTIADLVEIIKDKMGFEGTLEFDTSKPDGTMQKLLDSQKIRDLGWKPLVSLEEGIEKTIRFYRETRA
ncbi:MAG: GDP-L-fucose synthase [Bacteriovoracaceae bacterium]|nr:GDP-L-fucose synthase [Bacteriovoracaceae bacterium]